MFDLDQFVADCRFARGTDCSSRTIGEVIKRAVSDPAGLLKVLGVPDRAGIKELYRASDLSILNVVWAPRMMIMPHNHHMWAIISVYGGREDNIFWRRIAAAGEKQLEAAGARSLSAKDSQPLGEDIIHSVTNPTSKFTAAIHVYGGDFFAAHRSEWDPETLSEQPSERNCPLNSLKLRERKGGQAMNGIRTGFLDSIGNTPLIRLRKASEATGGEIYGKAEFLNPGGSIKDRAALAMVNDAERSGKLGPGGVIVEGTAGNVGIGIALVANARGYRSVIVMPDMQSQEKKDMLRLCGADLRLVHAVPYSNPGHYARYSGQLAEELGAFWANQFDNVANREGHYRTTGPEIWEQTGGKIDGFTCAVGSGGTLGGVARALKERNPAVTIALSDPMGAALYNWFTKGELTTEGDSITEGIGQVRVTRNLEGTPIDAAYRITDEEALPILFDLIEHEGLVLGGSSAINIVGAMRLARDLGPGNTIVTILADGGQRYQSKLFNPEFLRKKNLPTPRWMG